MKTKHPFHIAIAGAGLLGRLLAWRILADGYSNNDHGNPGCSITLYEAGSLTPASSNALSNAPSNASSSTPRAAAFTAAGMIAPLSEAVVSDESIYRMGQFALQQWPHWLTQLSTPTPLFFQRGSLVVAHPQDVNELIQFERELGFVLPQCTTYETLNQQQIHTLEPDLNTQFMHGLLLHEEGHINNRELLLALSNELFNGRITIREQTPVELAPGTVRTHAGPEYFDLVIDCRGLGAKSQQPNLRGVRGETLHVATKDIHLQRPVRLMHPRYQLYVVPKPNHQFIIGATQIESEDTSPVTLHSSLELSSALYTLSPAFAEAHIIEMDSNLRPAYMDNKPAVTVQDGLISANGLFRHGYLLAPAMVENILAHIFNKPAPVFNDILNHELPA